ncbi:MAG: hypothetical protein SFY95_00090 [Planctomycetota bacterium]|nr:hypothetical protein [Planctomycetota bacterium]
MSTDVESIPSGQAQAPATGPAPSEPSPMSAEASAPQAFAPALRVKPSLMDRADAFISRLSARNHFWQRICSMIWLPYAFRSGVRMRRVDENTITAVLPFRRFNRNWYNAMAGAALLANSEIAGGMYVFGIAGGEYTVVCKSLEYKFLRPCFGPAVYKITPREDLRALVAARQEFNITLDMDIVQQSLLPEGVRKGAEKVLPRNVGEKVAGKEKRVGRCVAVFHVTPKLHQQSKGRKIR